MNYAIFAYRDDAECLDLCIEQLRRVDAEASIYVFDDATAPLPAVPAGVHYSMTNFPRNGNLNGMECVKGMLMHMHAIPGDSPVVKIDSDTLLINPTEIKECFKSGFKAGGVEAFSAFAFTGICYWLSKVAIKDLIELFNERWMPNDKYPEDVTISRALFYLYGRTDVELLSAKHDKAHLGANYTDEPHLRALAGIAKDYIALHCGQSAHYGDLIDSGMKPRQACAWVMRQIINYQQH